MSFLGERPELPDDVVKLLHQNHEITYQAMEFISSAATQLYEQWKSL